MKVIAFVIGIDHYTHPDSFQALSCAIGDAKAIADAFSRLKFEVIESYDEDDDTVREKFDEFINNITDAKPDVAVFYFAGHGERANLKDGLVLKNAIRSSKGETVLLGHCLEVNSIMQSMNMSGNQMNILILDACRNETRGPVAKPETSLTVPFQTFIAYSTAAGCTASDGKAGGHSPFTAALLEHIMTENLKVEDLFKQVRKDMLASGRKQYSWDYSCLVDDFSFNHGQLNRHYGSTYSLLAFSKPVVSLADSWMDAFEQGIKNKSEEKIDYAMNVLVAHKSEFKPEQLFVMGRHMLHACNCSFATKYITITKLSLLNVGDRNSFFDGILYEMFFDGEDKCRNKNIEGVCVLDEVARVCDSPDFASSLAFIQKELEPFKKQVSFVPGNDIHTVKITLTKLDVCNNAKQNVWIIDDVLYADDSIADMLDATAYSRQGLRQYVKKKLRIPFRNLNIRTNARVEDDDVLIVADLRCVDDFIEDYYHQKGIVDFEEAGLHLEFAAVEGCEIEDFEESGGLLVVLGSFSISVVAYHDTEEDVKNDVTLDGVFKMTLEYSENSWSILDYDKMKLEAPSYLCQ